MNEPFNNSFTVMLVEEDHEDQWTVKSVFEKIGLRDVVIIRSVINNCAYRLVMNLVRLQCVTTSFASIYDTLYSVRNGQEALNYLYNNPAVRNTMMYEF